MAHNSDKKKNATAAVLQRADFIKFITEAVIAKYGPSYATPQSMGNKWREQIAYATEIEQFLIAQSRLYLRVTNFGDESKATNPAFLKALVNEMADYLSKYTMRAKEGMLRKDAEKALKRALFDNNSYIQGMLLYQSGKRHMRKTHTPAEIRVQQNKQKKKANNARNKTVATQVHILFIEANDFRKKR